ncbi:GIY-YIG nuclease family protein [Geminicoccaceae bacterium 1502E]|nr:GIY-YIG nuclease family protein [Geminicoccaceae bacterium 1502E]
MADPFTIRIFVPDGDPEGVRLIDRMNWTGLGIVFPRGKWLEVRERLEMSRTGVYILVGFKPEDENLPTLYVGQADGVRGRIDSHFKAKDFWDRAVVFVSNSGGLNRAHVTWLEHELVKRAVSARQCHLDNGNAPQEPAMSEAEKADTRAFLKEILQILPLVGVGAFEVPKPVATPYATVPAQTGLLNTSKADTIIVPAQKDGFEQVFLGEDCWYAIRIAGGMLDKIRYIAGYQSQPVSAITHFAPVARIEPYGEGGKYKVIFSEKAKTVGPIPFGDAPSGAMQSPRYTSFAKLLTASKLTDLLGKL